MKKISFILAILLSLSSTVWASDSDYVKQANKLKKSDAGITQLDSWLHDNYAVSGSLKSIKDAKTKEAYRDIATLLNTGHVISAQILLVDLSRDPKASKDLMLPYVQNLVFNATAIDEEDALSVQVSKKTYEVLTSIKANQADEAYITWVIRGTEFGDDIAVSAGLSVLAKQNPKVIPDVKAKAKTLETFINGLRKKGEINA